MVERWVASAWQLTEKHFRRVDGHGQLWALASILEISKDKRFAEKLEDIVGLYLNPPEHAIRGFTGHITAGGFFAHFNAHSLLRDCPAIDSVVYGEGEATLADLADALQRRETVAAFVCAKRVPAGA